MPSGKLLCGFRGISNVIRGDVLPINFDWQYLRLKMTMSSAIGCCLRQQQDDNVSAIWMLITTPTTKKIIYIHEITAHMEETMNECETEMTG